MKIGQAYKILDNINSDEYTADEKALAIRNDIHTAFDQKLESSISRTARLLCTRYSWLDSGNKDSASSAASGRR